MTEPRVTNSAITRRQFMQGALGVAVSVSALGALAGCGSGEGSSSASPVASSMATPSVKPQVDGDLSWLTWSGYVPPKVVKAFEKEYGVKVTESNFSNPQEYIQKLGAGLPFDLITTNSAYHYIEIQGKLIQPFDWADLKNKDNVLEWFQNPFYDNGEYRYTVPYGIGPTGFTYREDKVSNMAGKWDDFWTHADEASGHIYLLDEDQEAIGATLVRDGFPLNSEDPSQIKQAGDDIIKLKPDLGGISSDTQALMPEGRLWIGETWPVAVAFGMQASNNPEVWRFVAPEEGALIAADALSIGANAKAPGTALLFMDWILEAENNAALAAWDWQNTGGVSGETAYLETVKDYPDLQFDINKLIADQNLWKIAPTGERRQLYEEQWGLIKA
jgi:spermidine/putrescine transport system substrate-binding protein